MSVRRSLEMKDGRRNVDGCLDSDEMGFDDDDNDDDDDDDGDGMSRLRLLGY